MILALCEGDCQVGYAPHYNPGVMERVADNRGLPRTACMVSSPVYPVGTRVLVYGVATKVLLACRVTDVSAPKDRVRHIRTRRVVELGFTEAVRLCGQTTEPPKKCPVVVWEAR
jgi:hypothetical protein